MIISKRAQALSGHVEHTNHVRTCKASQSHVDPSQTLWVLCRPAPGVCKFCRVVSKYVFTLQSHWRPCECSAGFLPTWWSSSQSVSSAELAVHRPLGNETDYEHAPCDRSQ